jgi:hypothetical protein
VKFQLYQNSQSFTSTHFLLSEQLLDRGGRFLHRIEGVLHRLRFVRNLLGLGLERAFQIARSRF